MYAHSIRYALQAAHVKAQWYEQCGDVRFLKEVSDWLDVANIYLKQHCLESNINLSDPVENGFVLVDDLEVREAA